MFFSLIFFVFCINLKIIHLKATPYSLLPTPYSLLPIPYSLFPKDFAPKNFF
ncbi:MAG: hypothetical protein F6K65_26805 [Moorea sp. SIO3C2]|nr:hypothetical protein [Moorena sp. SIO3C2]